MEALIVLTITLGLLYVLFILPQQRRVRAHQQLVASLQEGDDVVLTAGIYGRIVELGPDEISLEVAPGTRLRVARQAVLRRAEIAADLGAEFGAEIDSGEPDDNNAERPSGEDSAGPTG